MKQLLRVEGKVTPQCSRSHITYTFYLPQGSSKISIHFNYEPKCLDDRQAAQKIICKELEHYIPEEDQQQYKDNWEAFLPLNNLITLSFDDASGFRGCAHRHDHDQLFIISEFDASPGLNPGIIASGHFKITLSIHTVVTDSCCYRLNVWEGDETLDKVDAFRASYSYQP